VTDPLHFAFDVDCAPAHAFALWTSRLSTWWPADHSVSGVAPLDVVLEGRVGGRIYERTRTGEEHEWGTVTSWDPPSTLTYTWHLGADRAEATDVEIRFLPVGEAKTRVEIDHRGWERLGTSGPARRERNQHGWGSVLPHFVEAVEKEAQQ